LLLVCNLCLPLASLLEASSSLQAFSVADPAGLPELHSNDNWL
jgi:hypothetical protein